MYFIGTAGWSLPRSAIRNFPVDGTHLQRYSQIFNCTEINSSFYRSHSFLTYRRWADSAPSMFRFAVKMPQAITHDARLRKTRSLIEQFLSEVQGLGRKLGPFLIQLPPSMELETRVLGRFLSMLRTLHGGPIVCEPRHRSYFLDRADKIFNEYNVSRVATDPPTAEAAAIPGGALSRLRYYRLHGSPRMYWSNYDKARLNGWAKEASTVNQKVKTWFIFDNTASGAATMNALQLSKMLDVERGVKNSKS